jgi:hypothetical protein
MVQNKQTNLEKKSKARLESAMGDIGVREHTTMVTFPDGRRIGYVARIAETTTQYIDVKEMAVKCGVEVTGNPEDVDRFFSMLTTSFSAVEANLGKNICANLKRLKDNLPALSVQSIN